MRARRETAKPTLLKRALASLVSAAMVVAFTPVVAWGATTGNVTYMDASGNKQTCASATEVTENTTSWSAGWYVAVGNVNVSQITFNGDISLILADGCNLIVTGGICGSDANDDESGYSLNIYGQEGSTGMLAVGENASGGNGGSGVVGGRGGSVTINGGRVTTAGSIAAGMGGAGDSKRGYSGGSGGSVTINGGMLTAADGITAGSGAWGGRNDNGGNGGSGGSVTINGGRVTTAGSITAGNGGLGGFGVSTNGGRGGNGGNGGNITISGGAVAAVGGIAVGSGGGGGFGANDIHGSSGASGTFTTGSDGTWCGLIFDGDQGKIYGESFALAADISIPGSKTLTILSGQTLTIAEGKTLTNSGTIYNSGTIRNSGTIENTAIFYNSGTIENSGSGGITGGAPANTNGTDGTGVIRSTITLHANGGAYSDRYTAPSSYVYNGVAVTLPRGETVSSDGDTEIPIEISKAGHYFIDWYDEDGNLVKEVPTSGLSAMTYYAKWEPKQYGITAVSNDLTFESVDYGYSERGIQRVNVVYDKETGSGLSGFALPKIESTSGDQSEFVINELETADEGSIASFTIRPKTGLDAGTHTEVIAIEGTAYKVAERNEDGTASRNSSEGVPVYTHISVSFTVEKASPKLTITPSSSYVYTREVVELEVVPSTTLPANAVFRLKCTQGTELYPAEKVSKEYIKKIGTNSFQVVAPSLPGAYRFRAELEGADNYFGASADCEINVSIDIGIDLPAKETTIDVGNDEKVGVVVSGGQAAVKEIGSELLETITKGEGSGQKGGLVLDLSNTGSKVTSVKLTKSTLENISDAVNDPGSSVESASVVTSTGTVELSKEALSSIASQVAGDATIGLSEKKPVDLNALQQAALERARELYGCYDASIKSGGSEVHVFGSGTVTLSFPLEPKPNTDPRGYKLTYVSEAGKLEYCPTTLKGGMLSGTTTHLSTYAIVYIEPEEQTLALAEALGALPKAAGLKAADAKAAVKAARAALGQVAALEDDQRAVVGDELVANAEQVVERGTALIAKADAKAAKKVRDKALSVKAGTKKAIAFKTKASAAGTRVTYKKVSGSKYITVTKAGKVTAKKDMRAGKKYTAKVKVTCGKAAEYVRVTVRAI